MTIMEKLTILTDAAKYDAACTSSGVGRAAKTGSIGNSMACGICHSFCQNSPTAVIILPVTTNLAYLPAGIVFCNKIIRSGRSAMFVAKNGVICNKFLFDVLLNRGFEEGKTYSEIAKELNINFNPVLYRLYDLNILKRR